MSHAPAMEAFEGWTRLEVFFRPGVGARESCGKMTEVPPRPVRIVQFK
jgi:hypothetical protein